MASELTEAEEAHRVAVRQLEAKKQRDVLHGEAQSLQQRKLEGGNFEHGQGFIG